jgi:UrcA family protein
MNTLKLATFAAATLTLAATLAPVVQAADVPAITLHYATAKVATEAGARDLYRRIAVAAEQVCPAAVGSDLGSEARTKRCQADAIARAVGQVKEQRVVEIAARARRG